MKKSIEIIGLPIISLHDGGEVGTVKSLVIDYKTASLAAIVIDDGQSYKGAKLVTFNDILGIGESALTIEQKASVKQYSQLPEIETLLEANVNVVKTRVLSKKGQIKGTVVEVYFDTDNGKIVECHAKNENGADFTIPFDRIYTLASNITVVTEDNETASQKPIVQEAVIQQPVVVTEQPKQVEPVVQQEQTTQQPTQTTEESSDANNAMQKFEERQKKFLIGKKSTRQIAADNGMVIIEQGEEVTEETIQKAKLAGKFVELSMSLQ